MQTSEEQPPIALEAWDWMAELARQDRTRRWLARRTGKSYTAVHRYGTGERTAPVAWLMAAASVLGVRLVELHAGDGKSAL